MEESFDNYFPKNIHKDIGKILLPLFTINRNLANIVISYLLSDMVIKSTSYYYIHQSEYFFGKKIKEQKLDRYTKKILSETFYNDEIYIEYHYEDDKILRIDYKNGNIIGNKLFKPNFIIDYILIDGKCHGIYNCYDINEKQMTTFIYKNGRMLD
jgi:hypothetical protein